jgi:hypothetical protein
MFENVGVPGAPLGGFAVVVCCPVPEYDPFISEYAA